MGRETVPPLSEKPTNDNARTVRDVALKEARLPSSKTVTIARGMRLDCGALLPELTIAYETYGALNQDKTNAVLVCHALTGDQYAASVNPVTGKPGWWLTLIGPGKAIDTDKYFVICANVLGSCLGSTGPLSPNPDTGRAYGIDLPVITIRDMVNAQKLLIDALGISTLFAVIGGSMGGMQVLQWAASYPAMVFSAVPIATGARHSPQNIAFHEVGRQAIMADPNWKGGRYASEGLVPSKGLGVARMAAHITYLSEEGLQRKFGRNLQNKEAVGFSFDADFQIESYLHHQGMTFVDRFDANSYLYVTRAMDYFDLAADYGGVLGKAFMGAKTRFCLISFSSDWLFPTVENRSIMHALNAAGASVSFAEIQTDKGHDSFLLDVPELFDMVGGFLSSAGRARGL
ncbi:MAG: homoserine O-acetyltransferase [Rhizobiales bacterium]|nr:homoserine O-acetyltransferase [Hyphomicrobiales bacterium]